MSKNHLRHGLDLSQMGQTSLEELTTLSRLLVGWEWNKSHAHTPYRPSPHVQ